MGLFSKKHKDEPIQQLFVDDNGMQNDPQHSSSVHTNPTLPPADHTLQSANIDGILPATAEPDSSSPVSSYTGFSEPVPPSVPNDDQNEFIMDPVPVSNPLVQNDSPAVQDEQDFLEDERPSEQPDEFNEPEVPEEQVEEEQPMPEPEVPSEEPVSEPEPQPEPEQATEELPGDVDIVATHHHTNDSELAELKARALKQLTPLAQHLDQSPEEKFHTTMMMLQATDDQNLVKVAYQAAESITDEKARAQALLDVINEINYFTQNK